MSKKKKKFKKKISQNLNERISQIAALEDKKDSPVPADPIRQKDFTKTTVDGAEKEYRQIRSDLIYNLFVILGLVVILFTIYFSNNQFHYLNQASDWLYKILNLSV